MTESAPEPARDPVPTRASGSAGASASSGEPASASASESAAASESARGAEPGAAVSPLRRWLPAATSVVMAVVLAVVDPWRAGAPWWQDPAAVGTGVLVAAFGVFAATAVVCGIAGLRWARTRAATIALVSGVLVVAMVVAVVLIGPLESAFPDAGRLWLSLGLGLVALPVLGIALMVVIVSPALYRVMERMENQQRRS